MLKEYECLQLNNLRDPSNLRRYGQLFFFAYWMSEKKISWCTIMINSQILFVQGHENTVMLSARVKITRGAHTNSVEALIVARLWCKNGV